MTGAEDKAITLIAIDDDPATRELLSKSLSGACATLLTALDPEEGLRLVREYRPDIVLVDLMMPRLDGMSLLERILNVAPAAEVILLANHYSAESAVSAIQRGAGDYLSKPLSTALLRERIEKRAEETRKRRRELALDKELMQASQFEGMIGRSPIMLDVFERIRRIAPHFETALLIGAPGTGKELAARALHRLSPVSSGRFVVCDCSAIAESRFEGELFGHIKGACAGAFEDKAGLLENARGGVLFLDEIWEMPAACQNSLARALETREFQRVGSPVPHKTDVRIVAAANRNLHVPTERQQFRKDLYHRLAMAEIALPALAERREDIPHLSGYFLEKFARHYNKPVRGMTAQVKILLSSYSWPGNVRELENVIGHACMMSQGDIIDVRDLPWHFGQALRKQAPVQADIVPLAELNRAQVVRALERSGGNKALAAKMLGIDRTTLYRILKRSGKS